MQAGRERRSGRSVVPVTSPVLSGPASSLLSCTQSFCGACHTSQLSGSDNTYLRSRDNLVVHVQVFCFYKGPEAGQELFLKKKEVIYRGWRGHFALKPYRHGPWPCDSLQRCACGSQEHPTDTWHAMASTGPCAPVAPGPAWSLPALGPTQN